MCPNFEFDSSEVIWEPCQTSKMKRFAKKRKTLHLRSWIGFWMRLCLYTYDGIFISAGSPSSWRFEVITEAYLGFYQTSMMELSLRKQFSDESRSLFSQKALYHRHLTVSEILVCFVPILNEGFGYFVDQ